MAAKSICNVRDFCISVEYRMMSAAGRALKGRECVAFSGKTALERELAADFTNMPMNSVDLQKFSAEASVSNARRHRKSSRRNFKFDVMAANQPCAKFYGMADFREASSVTKSKRLPEQCRASLASFPVENTSPSSSRLRTEVEEGQAEALSCICIGPVELEDQETLEALYRQARDAYYNGRPIIVDEMFDRVETQLRRFRSKLVMKYPRCSLKAYYSYADMESDDSQIWTLAGIWLILLAGGAALAAGPAACAMADFCRDAFHEVRWHGLPPPHPTGTPVLETLVAATGLLLGIPVVSSAASSLRGMVNGDIIALKGNCPNCGEEVYTFMKAEEVNSDQPPHRSECHVCERPLVFRPKLLEQGAHSPLGRRRWAYGRVYLAARPSDLAPERRKDS